MDTVVYAWTTTFFKNRGLITGIKRLKKKPHKASTVLSKGFHVVIKF